MLSKTVWRQYHDSNNFREILSPFCNITVGDMIEDDKELYSVIKAKLTKRELKLLAMDTAKVDDATIQKELDIDSEELKVAKFKVYKKLKQDKFRLSIRATNALEEDNF